MKESIPSTVIASQLIDVGPIEDAIKAMRVAVEEGLGILKHAKKQLRINVNTATMQVSTLRSGTHSFLVLVLFPFLFVFLFLILSLFRPHLCSYPDLLTCYQFWIMMCIGTLNCESEKRLESMAPLSALFSFLLPCLFTFCSLNY